MSRVVERRQLLEALTCTANVRALGYWGAFCYQVEERLNALATRQGLRSGENFIVVRDFAVGAEAICKPIEFKLFSSPALTLQSQSSKLVSVIVSIRPASLWFTIGPDGSVLALVEPFRKSDGEPPFERYVVGVLERPQDLSSRWLRRCFDWFVRLVLASHPIATPTAVSQRVLEDGLGRHNRLTGTPANPGASDQITVAAGSVMVALLAMALGLLSADSQYPELIFLLFWLVVIVLGVVFWLFFRRMRLFPR